MLYLITNRSLAQMDFYEVIEQAVYGGVDRIILREKDLPQNDLFIMAGKIKNIIRETNCKLIINGDLAVAKKINAYGFQASQPHLVGGEKLYPHLGVATHSLTEAKNGIHYQCDYLLVSHIYPTLCKEGLAPKGIELIKQIKAWSEVPIIALGGITPERIGEVIDAGASGVAVMSNIMASSSPYDAAKVLKQELVKGRKGSGDKDYD